MRRDYLSRLSRAARWYLPPAEAAEVLEDYREIVAGRSEEELRRGLGTPRAAMRQHPEHHQPPPVGFRLGQLAHCRSGRPQVPPQLQIGRAHV